MNKAISILGCGWFGLALARELVLKGHTVKGSTTSPAKLAIIKAEGIAPYLINFKEEHTHIDPGFFDCSTLIICIPPKRRTGGHDSFLSKIGRICEAATDRAANVLFISSTSVYGDHNCEVTEDSLPEPDGPSGRILLQAEALVQNSFDTTVIRFGGLIGPGRDPGRFFAGKTAVPNGLAPVNLIHLNDCIGLTLAIIEKAAFGHVFNACTPDHPAKQHFYTRATINSGLEIPVFINERLNWKIVSSKNSSTILNYKYLINNWNDWLFTDKL